MVKVIITGANGQLGQALRSISQKLDQIDFIFFGSDDLDITNSKTAKDIFNKHKPQFCINAAAYTAVDKAESEPEKAFDINVSGVINLANACKENDVTLIHVSTDFVFDGHKNVPYTELDETHPIGVYGRTKREGELALEQILEKHYIIRTSWVYSQFGNNFMKTMLRLAKERDSLSIVADQTGTPTNAVDLAGALIDIIMADTQGTKAYGIYNFSNEGQCSWFDFAKEIFLINGVDINLEAIATADYPTPCERPKYSVLDKTKIKEVFGLTIADWNIALKNVLNG